MNHLTMGQIVRYGDCAACDAQALRLEVVGSGEVLAVHLGPDATIAHRASAAVAAELDRMFPLWWRDCGPSPRWASAPAIAAALQKLGMETVHR